LGRSFRQIRRSERTKLDAVAALPRVKKVVLQQLNMRDNSWNKKEWNHAPIEPKTPPNPLKNDKAFLKQFPYLAEPW
jgi:hypothetical protein